MNSISQNNFIYTLMPKQTNTTLSTILSKYKETFLDCKGATNSGMNPTVEIGKKKLIQLPET